MILIYGHEFRIGARYSKLLLSTLVTLDLFLTLVKTILV